MDKLKPCRGITTRSWLDKDESSHKELEDDPVLPARLGRLGEGRGHIRSTCRAVDGDGTIDGQKMDQHSLEPKQMATPHSGLTVETGHVLDDDDGCQSVPSDRESLRPSPRFYCQP